MTVPPRSEQPVTDDDEQAFLASLPRSKGQKLGRPLPARGASPSQWAIRAGLTLLIAVLVVFLYVQWSGHSLWANTPTVATTTPTAQPNPAPAPSSEPAMSGGYQIGPDGVLVRPAEHAASTYTKPELPEAAKENTERGAEAAAEYVLDTLTYAWNTGDTQPFADITESGAKFHDATIDSIDTFYADGWVYGNTSSVTSILSVEPISDPKWGAQPNTIGVVFKVSTTNGTACMGQRIIVSESPFHVRVVLFMTWKDGRWIATEGSISDYEEQ